MGRGRHIKQVKHRRLLFPLLSSKTCSDTQAAFQSLKKDYFFSKKKKKKKKGNSERSTRMANYFIPLQPFYSYFHISMIL